MPDPELNVLIDGVEYDQSSLTLPSDRIFRNAWAAPVSNIVDVVMADAREIWKDKLRQDRMGRFDPYDVIVTKNNAKGVGNGPLTGPEKQAILDAEAEREKLRNITDDVRITNAATPAELAALDIDTLLAP